MFKCAVKSDGNPDIDLLEDVKNYIYRINWTRFGSVTMDKWVAKYDKDDDDNDVMIYGGWVAR